MTAPSTRPERVGPPALAVEYDRSRLRPGIVHFGPGAFHRAHQATYLDDLFRRGVALDWAICDVGLLPGDRDVHAALVAQDCLYTVTTKHPDGSWTPRVVGSVVANRYAPADPDAVLELLAVPSTRAVTLTITEGGYGLDPDTGEFAPTADDLLADLADPGAPPRSVFGHLVHGLRRRRQRGLGGLTVLSCDNLPENGAATRRALLAFAGSVDPATRRWIEAEVSFPNSMVDRVTPVTTAADRAELRRRTGVEDAAPVFAEPFRQWVVEDRFVAGRPPLEEVGVELVDDVARFEQMKLRLLNASHQVLAHLGTLRGHTYVHEALLDPRIREVLTGYLREEAVPTLTGLSHGVVERYLASLLDRFGNAELADTCLRNRAYASDRMKAFLVPVVEDLRRRGRMPRRAVLTIAAWATWVQQSARTGAPEVVDHRAEELRRAAIRLPRDAAGFLRAAGMPTTICDDADLLAELTGSLQVLEEG
jgi:mannitol 2-dehydrogenase